MAKMQEIKAATGSGHVSLNLTTDAAPILRTADQAGAQTSQSSPPDQSSDLLAWLDGILDGIAL